MELFYHLFQSPIGPIWLVSGRNGLSFLIWNKSESEFLLEMERRMGQLPKRDSRYSTRFQDLLERYFSGVPVLFTEPISFLQGTFFEKKVWRTLMDIPYGETRSYQWVSEQLKMPAAARAVGNACGKNPLPIVVPCHRVVRQNGFLGGYTGGVHIKKSLLKIEGVL